MASAMDFKRGDIVEYHDGSIYVVGHISRGGDYMVPAGIILETSDTYKGAAPEDLSLRLDSLTKLTRMDGCDAV
jgi:hypothetical protein